MFVLRRIRRFVSRTLYYTALAGLAGTACTAVAVRSDWFRDWIKDYAFRLLDESLQARIRFDDFRGSPFSGFDFSNVSVVVRGDTLLSAPLLTVYWDPLELLAGTVAITKLRLDHPVVSLERYADSTWNFENIARPTEDTVRAGTPPPRISIALYLLDVDGATVRVRDAVAPQPVVFTAAGRKVFNPVDMDLRDVSLRANARIDLARAEHTLSVESLTARDDISGFALHTLSATAVMRPHHAEITEAVVRTEGSSLSLSVRLDSVDLLSGEVPWEKSGHWGRISLLADSVDLDEVQQFAPEMGDLTGRWPVRLVADGTFEKLSVRSAAIGLPGRRQISVRGNIRNLLDADNMFIEAATAPVALEHRDLQRLFLSPLGFDLSSLGRVQLSEVTYSGTLSRFSATASAVSPAAGTVKAAAEMDFSKHNTAYNLTATLLRFNPRAVPHAGLASGIVNGSVAVSGEGFNPATMRSKVLLNLAESSYDRWKVRSGLLSASVDSSLATLDTLALNFYSPSYAQDVTPSVSLTGSLSLRNPHIPLWDLQGSTYHLDLQQVAGESFIATDLNGSVEARGEGFHPDSLAGELHVDLRSVSTPYAALSDAALHLVLDRGDEGRRTLTLESPYAKARLDGRWSTASLQAIAERLESALRQESELVAATVTDVEVVQLYDVSAEDSDTLQAVDAALQVEVIDLDPIDTLLGNIDIDVAGTASMSLRGTPAKNTFRLESLALRKGIVRLDTAVTIVLPETVADGYFSTDLTGALGPSFGAAFNLVADSSTIINGLPLRGVAINTRLEGYNLCYAVRGNVGDIAYLNLIGSATNNVSDIAFRIDTSHLWFYAEGNDPLLWRATAPLRFAIADGALRIDSFEVAREDAESISLRGTVSPSRFDSLRVGITNFPLRSVNDFLPEHSALVPLQKFSGRITRGTLLADGSFESPTFELLAVTDAMSYDSTSIGSQTISLAYARSNISGFTTITSATSAVPTLDVRIKQFPLDLSLASVESRLPSDKPVDVRLKASDLQLSLLAPFVPGIHKLEGRSDAELQLVGPSLTSADYGGRASLRKGAFTVSATNVRYGAEGAVRLDRRSVVIDSLMLMNTLSDLRGGKADVRGQIALNGFDIQGVDITMASKGLLVMNAGTRAVNPNLYGELVVATGRQPLRFSGSMDSPHLEGDVVAVRGSLFLPEDKSIRRSGRRFCYQERRADGHVEVVYGDCAGQAPRDTLDTAAALPDADSQQALRARGTQPVSAPPTSIADRIQYDISLSIARSLFVQMEFSPFEELIAEVGLANPDIPLRYTTDERTGTELIRGGALEVRKGSSYKFYRIFNATGQIWFPTGDISNPGLRLVAELSGQRRLNDKLQNYTVDIDISGTKKKPAVALTYSIDGVDAGGDSAKVQTDAIMMIVFGKRQEELFGGSGSGFSANDITSQGTSSFASKLLTDVLQGTGIIRSADIYFANNAQSSGSALDLSQARVKFSGEIAELGVMWQYGQDLGNFDLSSASFTIDVPLGAFLDVYALRSLVLEIGRTATVTTWTRQQRDWEFKLGIRHTW